MKREEKLAHLEAAGYPLRELEHYRGSTIALARTIAARTPALTLRQIEKVLRELLPRGSRPLLRDTAPALRSYYCESNAKPFDELFARGVRPFRWLCARGHSFELSPVRMAAWQEPCPFCANRRVLSGWNDLASQRPELLDEWDYARNDFAPEEVYLASSLKAHWLCGQCSASWVMMIANRTLRGAGCPKCSKTSYYEKLVYEVLQKSYGGIIVRNSYPLRQETKRYQLDFFLPELKLAFEVQDRATHSRTSDEEALAGQWLYYAKTKGLKLTKKGPTYHALKRRLVEEQLSSQLVELWEDDFQSEVYAELIAAALASAEELCSSHEEGEHGLATA